MIGEGGDLKVGDEAVIGEGGGKAVEEGAGDGGEEPAVPGKIRCR